MKRLKKWLMGNAGNSMRASVFWNLASSVGYSFQSAILMLAVTRSNGLRDAGVFTIAYTVTQMMSTIGSYGMRSFQVSDCRDEYTFHTYFTSRVLSTAAMAGACLLYSWKQGYGGTRMVLVAILCSYRIWESMEDIIHGEMQKEQRLDIAARIETVRILLATFIFAAGCFLTRNVLLATAAMSAGALLMTVLLNGLVLKEFRLISFSWQSAGTSRLLWACFPVCVSGFLYNYLVNAPKYAIDRNLSEESQAVFSILFMPIFIINVLSSFIYKPLIASMGISWTQGDRKGFLRIVLRQLLLIIGLTLFITAGGILIGLHLLGLIYGIELGSYKCLFALLLVFGGLAAADAFMVVALTVVRKQQWTLVAYTAAVLCVWACMDRAVLTYGLWGGGILYGMVMGVILVILMAVFFHTLYRQGDTSA